VVEFKPRNRGHDCVLVVVDEAAGYVPGNIPFTSQR
jgi:hypothetical protein